MLEELNKHEKDGKKKNEYTSVTKLLDMYYPFPPPNAYMREQIELGTELHTNIENFYNNKPKINTSIEFHQFREFAEYATNVLELEAYRTEWNVYDDNFMLSGTIDMVFRKKNDPFVFYLVDWKRSRNSNDGHIYRYTIQLNLYKQILERNYGIQVHKLLLVCFHPTNIRYQIVDIPDKKVSKYLNHSTEIHFSKSQIKRSPWKRRKCDNIHHTEDNTVVKSETILMKRKKCENDGYRKCLDNDSSNILNWMTGGKRLTRKFRHSKYNKKRGRKTRHKKQAENHILYING